MLYVVDDGSSDDTQVVLDKYKHFPQVHLLFQENRGVSSARNLAVQNSHNKWISFLDSDDEWMPKKLETQVDFIKQNSEYNFVHSEELWIRNGKRVNPKLRHQKGGENLFERSLDLCLISPSTVLMTRELFLSSGPFDESFVVCEDYDLWLKIMIKEKIGFIDEPLTIKNGGHEDQLSTKFVAMDYWRIKSLVKLFKSKDLSEEMKTMIKNVLIKKSEILLKGYLKHQNQKAFDEITSELVGIIPLK